MEVTLYPLWKEAVKTFVAEFTYGSVIPRQWFLEAFAIELLPLGTRLTEEEWEERSFAWLRSFDPFRQDIQDTYHMLLTPVEGRCYKVEESAKQGRRVYKQRVGKIEREMLRLQRGLASVDVERLTHTERNELEDLMGKANGLAKNVLSNPNRKRLPYGNEDDPPPTFKKRKGV